MMKSLKKVFIIFVLVLSSVASILYFQKSAFNPHLQYMPLANGFISCIADLQLDPNCNLKDKIIKTFQWDLPQGRIRPVSYLHTTFSYALFPIVHGYFFTIKESLPLNRIVNGDMHIIAFVLLSSVAIATILGGILIYRFTGSIIFACFIAPFVFLSITLTENLQQNYIDSQEIPLVLWVSLWLYTFLENERRFYINGGTSFFFIVASFIFMFLFFFTKETGCVLTAVLVCYIALTFVANHFMLKRKLPFKKCFYYIGYLSFFIIFTIFILYSVKFMTFEYASNYKLNRPLSELLNNLNIIWTCLSKNSLNNIIGWSALIFMGYIVARNRNQTFRDVPIIFHYLVVITLISTAFIFMLALLPWQWPMAKYVFPSTFFMTLAYLYAFGFISSWFHSKNKRLHMAILSILVVIFLFRITPLAKYTNLYSCEIHTGNRHIINALVKDIAHEVKRSNTNHIKLHINFKIHVPWAPLQLMRILNFDYGINIMDKNKNYIRNFAMPEGELSYFQVHPEAKSITFAAEKEIRSKSGVDLWYNHNSEKRELTFENDGAETQYVFKGNILKNNSLINKNQYCLYKYYRNR